MAQSYLKPPTFTVANDNIIQSWKDFLEEFSFYILATDMEEEPDTKKIAVLLCCMGRDYIKVYKNFTFDPAGDKDNFDKVSKAFTEHFEPKKLTKLFVTKFQNRLQQPGESVADYVTALKDLSRNCEFGADLEERMLAIQISNGVRDEDLRRKLWDDDLSLSDSIKRCHNHEQRKDNKSLYGEQANVHYFSHDRGRGRPRGRGRGGRGRRPDYSHQDAQHSPANTRGRGRGRSRGSYNRGSYNSYRGSYNRGSYRSGSNTGNRPGSSDTCDNCNLSHPPNRCPAYGKECNYCHCKGHFISACQKRLSKSNPSNHYMKQDTPSDYGPDTNRQDYGANDGTSVYTVAQEDVFIYGLTKMKTESDKDTCLENEHLQHSDIFDYSHDESEMSDLNRNAPTFPLITAMLLCMYTMYMYLFSWSNSLFQGFQHTMFSIVQNSKIYCLNMFVSHTCTKLATFAFVFVFLTTVIFVTRYKNSHIYALNFCKDKRCNQWCESLTMCDGNVIHFKIDTQGDVTVFSSEIYEKLKPKPILSSSTTVIKGFGGLATKSVGSLTLPVKKNDGSVYYLKVEVVDCKCPSILSDSDSHALGLVKRLYPTTVLEPRRVPESTLNIVNKYKGVMEGIGCIPGIYSLKFNPDIKPVNHPPRPIPAALREAAKKKLDQLEASGIIQKIPVGMPTPWCSSLHTVPKKKKNGQNDVRITIDPKDLNRALLREFHPISTIEDVITRTNGSKFFTVFDANQGFFQIKLDDQSALLTTFNTAFGRYFYKRLPMGISSAPEIYQRAMTELFAGIDGVEIVMDDILVHGETIEIHNKRVEKVLQRCQERNLRLNPTKTKLAQTEVEYVGQVLTAEGVRISQEKIKAVQGMRRPSEINNVHTLLGMVNYTMKFIPELSSITEPLRQLIKESNEYNFKFHWDPVHEEAFLSLKKMMASAPVLRYYSITDPITISCDASQSGLGMVLFQKDRPVAYGSKSLTNAEYAYGQIEKELLAIVVACKKFHTYIYGRSDITIETDHLPLLRVLEKPLHQVPLRLQKMRMRLQQYDFRLVHKPGKDIPVADNLSRLHLAGSKTDVPEFTVLATELGSTLSFSQERLAEITKETQDDPELSMLTTIITTGWPERRIDLDPIIRPYWDFREEMNTVDNIVFKGTRVVIPSGMRKRVLDILHASHQGMVRTKQLARDLLYWPGINSQIEDLISKCGPCQQHRNYQSKEPLMPSEIPNSPWVMVAADLFTLHGRKYLIVIDYYSEWFEIEELGQDSAAPSVIEKTKKILATHGIPLKMLTDNGPPFDSHKFRQFAKDYGFTHITMSPRHSQTNGLVEKAVQIAKRTMVKCEEDKRDITLAMLNMRNTPRDNITGSPAQRLMGRRTRTTIPTSNTLLTPKTISPIEVQKKMEDHRQTAKSYYDRGAKELTPLQEGDRVRVRDQKVWKPALLMPSAEQPKYPRSYNVLTPSGRVWTRNRRDLLRTEEQEIFRRQINDDTYEPAQPQAAIHVPNSPFRPPANDTLERPMPSPNQSPPSITNAPTQKSPYVSKSGRTISLHPKYKDYDMK